MDDQGPEPGSGAITPAGVTDEPERTLWMLGTVQVGDLISIYVEGRSRTVVYLGMTPAGGGQTAGDAGHLDSVRLHNFIDFQNNTFGIWLSNLTWVTMHYHVDSRSVDG